MNICWGQIMIPNPNYLLVLRFLIWHSEFPLCSDLWWFAVVLGSTDTRHQSWYSSDRKRARSCHQLALHPPLSASQRLAPPHCLPSQALRTVFLLSPRQTYLPHLAFYLHWSTSPAGCPFPPCTTPPPSSSPLLCTRQRHLPETETEAYQGRVSIRATVEGRSLLRTLVCLVSVCWYINSFLVWPLLW